MTNNNIFDEELSANFKNAAYEYDNDVFSYETIEHGDDLEILRNRFKGIKIRTSHRDACAFWQWYSNKLDATFLMVECWPTSKINELVAEFIAKYDR